jgi:HSP20 family protein
MSSEVTKANSKEVSNLSNIRDSFFKVRHDIDFVDDLISNFFNDFGISSLNQNLDNSTFIAKQDLIQTENSAELQIEVPGIDEKDINIQIENGYLVVSGEKKKQDVYKNSKGKVYHSEISYGKFYRQVKLGQNVDVDNIQANCKNGILSISLPYKEIEKENIKKIEINKNKQLV